MPNLNNRVIDEIFSYLGDLHIVNKISWRYVIFCNIEKALCIAADCGNIKINKHTSCVKLLTPVSDPSVFDNDTKPQLNNILIICGIALGIVLLKKIMN